jgi:hypothetical protein
VHGSKPEVRWNFTLRLPNLSKLTVRQIKPAAHCVARLLVGNAVICWPQTF